MVSCSTLPAAVTLNVVTTGPVGLPSGPSLSAWHHSPTSFLRPSNAAAGPDFAAGFSSATVRAVNASPARAAHVNTADVFICGLRFGDVSGGGPDFRPADTMPIRG